jgi:hypothetical protein
MLHIRVTPEPETYSLLDVQTNQNGHSVASAIFEGAELSISDRNMVTVPVIYLIVI